MDAEVIGILSGIGIALLIALFIFIIKIRDGLFEALEVTFEFMIKISFFLMLIGSILAPVIDYYIAYKKIEFILGDFIKKLFFNAIILIASTPLVSIIITIIAFIGGFILSFPIYKIIYKVKARRIGKTECWAELKQFFLENDFKNNIVKYTLFREKIEFEFFDNNEILVFSFKKRGYNDLTQTQQLTLIDMIKKETKTAIKIEVHSYVSIYDVYNRPLLKKRKKEDKKQKIIFKKEKRMVRKRDRYLRWQKKRDYKRAVKSGKNW